MPLDELVRGLAPKEWRKRQVHEMGEDACGLRLRACSCPEVDDLEDGGHDRLERELRRCPALTLTPVALLQEDRERDMAVLDALDPARSGRVGLDEGDMSKRRCVVDALCGGTECLPDP